MTTDTARKYNFGVQTPCSEEKLKDVTKDLFAKFSLTAVGDFYLTYGAPESSRKNWFKFHMHFYDSGNEILHTHHTSVFVYERVPHTDTKVVTIDTCTFILEMIGSWPCLLCFDNKWTTSKITILAAGRETMRRALGQQSPKTESLMSKIRTGTPGDFHLKSIDGTLLEVHTSVLIPQWEFFAAAAKSDMKEATEKIVEIQAPTTTLEVIVRHFYEQDLDMTFEDAANLVVIAQMYNLPELVTLATEKIKSSKKGVDENLTAWQKSLEAENEELRTYSASKLQSLMPDIAKSKERIDEMSKQDLTTLLMDMSLAAQEDVAPESEP